MIYVKGVERKEFMNNQILIELKNKFDTIKKIGWIKSIRKGSTGIGATFENVMGLNENSFEIPDFNGIEIKTKRNYSNSYTSLFNYSPEGKYCYKIEQLKNKFGYPDKIIKNCKVLNKSFFCNIKVRVSNYYFTLKVDRSLKKVILKIIDLYGNLIEDEIYWDFKEIEEKLNRKLHFLAFVNASRKITNKEEYFKYYKMDLYKLKDFDTFIYLLENGIIRITFKMSIFRTGLKCGQIHNHGTSFDIKEEDLLKLFNKIDSFN